MPKIQSGKSTEKNTAYTRKMRIIDGFIVSQSGKKAKRCRIHMSYCLNTGAMDEIIVTIHHVAEGFKNFTGSK
ncbi:MAG: hypothetical protein FWG10_10780 [Eubacteriaceae bacterium]|nr:hypothetical protein [Eubacteriaceae bacterium]